MKNHNSHTNRRILALLGASLIGATALSAEVRLSESTALAFGIESGVTHTSNVSLNSAENDDTILSFLPNVKFRSDGGATLIDAFVGVEVLRYDEYDSNDSENFKSGITITFPEERDGENFSLIFEGGFNEFTTASPGLQQITTSEVLTLGLSGTYYVSEYLELRSGVSYSDSETETAGYADVEVIELPLAAYYRFDETLSAGLGYRYRTTDVTGVTPDADSEDHAFYVGVEDLISPLLQYEIKLGYQFREVDDDVNFDDDSGVFSEMLLTWYITERSQLIGTVGSEFSTGAASQPRDTVYAELTLEHSFDERISAAVGTRYMEVDYDQITGTRSDDEWSLFLSGNYEIIENRWSLRGSLSYADHGSNEVTADYDVFKASLYTVFVF